MFVRPQALKFSGTLGQEECPKARPQKFFRFQNRPGKHKHPNWNYVEFPGMLFGILRVYSA
jgi:hypothetical protein